MVGTTAAILGAIIASTAGGVATGVMGSSASGKAAKAQEDSTKYAADLTKQAADDSLAFQKQTYATQQEQMQPWLQAGTGAVQQLSDLMQPGGALTKEFDPNSVDVTKNPSYAFRMQEAQKALERSAAAKGSALSGGTMKALTRYSQDYASTEYQNAYNRAFNTFQTNQGNTFNRLSALSGTGQQAVNTLGQEGSTAANNVTNIYGSTAAQLGSLATQGGNARASGYVGSANAWSNAFGGVTNSITNSLMMSQLLKNPYSPYMMQQYNMSPAAFAKF